MKSNKLEALVQFLRDLRYNLDSSNLQRYEMPGSRMTVNIEIEFLKDVFLTVCDLLRCELVVTDVNHDLIDHQASHF
jgi:hypothetical protein